MQHVASKDRRFKMLIFLKNIYPKSDKLKREGEEMNRQDIINDLQKFYGSFFWDVKSNRTNL